MLVVTATEAREAHIQLQDIINYLQSHGWVPLRVENKHVRIFTAPAEYVVDRPIRTILPHDDTYEDTFERIALTINLLSKLEKIPPQEIIHFLSQTNKDLLKIRVLLKDGDFLTVEKASLFIDAIKNLLTYSACAVLSPKQPYFTHPIKKATKQIQKCLFAHTFPGSFGFAIGSPVIQLEFPEMRKIGSVENRQVIERIILGLHSLKKAVSMDNVEFMIDHFQQGLNANMCEALMALKQQTIAYDLEYSVEWASILPPLTEIAHLEPILLSTDEYKYLRIVRDRLRDQIPQDGELEVIQGKIIKLESKKGENIRRIMISPINRIKQISINVSPEYYRLACNAHRDELDISVTGIVISKNNKLHLEDVTDFRVLNDNDE